MAKWAVIYSSITGNTREIAEAIAAEMRLDKEVDVFRIEDAPADVSGYEVVALGYWLRRGGPDDLMKAYMPNVKNTKVIFFQTHGTEPTSEHAMTAFARAGNLIGEGNFILGTFGCVGKVSPKLIEKRLQNATANDDHVTEEKMRRWERAKTHPDEQDKANARALIARIKKKKILNS